MLPLKSFPALVLFPPPSMARIFLPSVVAVEPHEMSRWAGPCNREEDKSVPKIITATELQGRSLTGLHRLCRAVEQELAQSAAGCTARRDALASLENISRAIAF